MQQLYHSTRSDNEFVTSKQAIIDGIASDGGLYVMDGLENTACDLGLIATNTFQQNAFYALSRLLPDFDYYELKSCIHDAYKTFSTKKITPLTRFGDDFLLELYHGPTCAFKDVALQILPHLMAHAKDKKQKRIHILTATSGDTGKAALEGFADVEGVAITVFYPKNGVSDIQQLQMQTQVGENVQVCAIEGNFDDAQSGVKRIFQDIELKKRLKKHKISLSSANSINIGRLAPQLSYYFDTYSQLSQINALKLGDGIDFVVPTGNFGDIFAGYLAKKMGLPINRLVIASNANNVLTDFIQTGTYNRVRPFHTTISPSMDILISSNLERLLYYVSEGDVELISSLMHDLEYRGAYTIPKAMLDTIQETFSAGFATDTETKEAIKHAWQDKEKLIDPHTAVAVHVRDQFEFSGSNCVILSTANPYKFSRDVLSAINPNDAELATNGIRAMDLLYGNTNLSVPNALAKLQTLPILHDMTIAVKDMAAYVEANSMDVFN